MTPLHAVLQNPRTDDARWEQWRAEYAATDRRTTRQMTWVAIAAAFAVLGWMALA